MRNIAQRRIFAIAVLVSAVALGAVLFWHFGNRVIVTTGTPPNQAETAPAPDAASAPEPSTAQTETSPSAASDQQAPPTDAEVHESIRKAQREAVRSNLTCESMIPMRDGRSFVMDVVRQGERLRVTGFAVNGPDDQDQLWDTIFSQNNDGMWASYNDAENIKTTLLFDDEDAKTGFVLSVTGYLPSGETPRAGMTGDCERAN